MELSIKVDASQALDVLRGQARQMPFAVALALTRTAQIAQGDEQLEIRDVFDRPTPYTMGAVGFTPATRANLTSAVFLKGDTFAGGTPATKYLAPEIAGGERNLKRFERALRAVGALPEGYFIVPGAAARIDGFGNMERGQIIQILSYFRAFPEAGYKANISEARRQKLARGTKRKPGYEYFVGAPGNGKLPLGIWQRFHLGAGSAIKPVMIFVKSTLYEARYDFAYTAQKSVERQWPIQIERALHETLRTAR